MTYRSNYDYRLEAKRACRSHNRKLSSIYLITLGLPLAISIYLTYYTMIEGYSHYYEAYTNGALWLVNLFPIILAPVYMYSSVMISKKIYHNVEPEIMDIFRPFNKYFKLLGLYLCISFMVLISCVVPILPIVTALKYSMAFYVLSDNPKLSIIQCMKKSKELMYGHKSRLFGLYFSYFLHYVLALITFGFTLVYSYPRIMQAQCLFYSDLVGAKPKEKITITPNEIHEEEPVIQAQEEPVNQVEELQPRKDASAPTFGSLYSNNKKPYQKEEVETVEKQEPPITNAFKETSKNQYDSSFFDEIDNRFN